MSTKEFGCFLCSGKSVERTGVCPTCHKPIDVGSTLLSEDMEGYHPIGILGRGYYGWTLKVERSYRTFALKLIPVHRLDSKFTDNEAHSLAACSPHRNIALFWHHFYTSISLGDQVVPVLGLVFEFIENALSLNELLIDSTVSLSRKDVRDILAGISSGAARMHLKGIWHDDLHDDNVLVRRVGPDENLAERYEAKLIDFGSTKPLKRDEPEHGERGDYHYLAKHIDVRLFPRDLIQAIVALNKKWSDTRRRPEVAPPPNDTSPLANVSYYKPGTPMTDNMYFYVRPSKDAGGFFTIEDNVKIVLAWGRTIEEIAVRWHQLDDQKIIVEKLVRQGSGSSHRLLNLT